MNTRIITADDPVDVAPDTDRLAFNRTAAGAVEVRLPKSHTRDDRELVLSDFGGNTEITILPADGETIMSQARFAVLPGATLRLIPSAGTSLILLEDGTSHILLEA